MMASWPMHLHQASFHAAGEARINSLLDSLAVWLSAKPFPDWDGLPKILVTTPLCYRELFLNFETAVAIAFPVLYAITHDTLHGKQLASFAAVSCQYARTFSPPSTDGD